MRSAAERRRVRRPRGAVASGCLCVGASGAVARLLPGPRHLRPLRRSRRARCVDVGIAAALRYARSTPPPLQVGDADWPTREMSRGAAARRASTSRRGEPCAEARRLVVPATRGVRRRAAASSHARRRHLHLGPRQRRRAALDRPTRQTVERVADADGALRPRAAASRCRRRGGPSSRAAAHQERWRSSRSGADALDTRHSASGARPWRAALRASAKHDACPPSPGRSAAGRSARRAPRTSCQLDPHVRRPSRVAEVRGGTAGAVAGHAPSVAAAGSARRRRGPS